MLSLSNAPRKRGRQEKYIKYKTDFKASFEVLRFAERWTPGFGCALIKKAARASKQASNYPILFVSVPPYVHAGYGSLNPSWQLGIICFAANRDLSRVCYDGD